MLGRSRLPGLYETLLRYGDTKGHYRGDGSARVYATIMSAIQHHVSKEWLLADEPAHAQATPAASSFGRSARHRSVSS